ncbi:hypothetical protein PHSC3_000492 [Chlamydiales bacterium STE3]|nr:hypothetical protein PHSC3_000492 [Chlamydiales bacterium STE3]
MDLDKETIADKELPLSKLNKKIQELGRSLPAKPIGSKNSIKKENPASEGGGKGKNSKVSFLGKIFGGKTKK